MHLSAKFCMLLYLVLILYMRMVLDGAVKQRGLGAYIVGSERMKLLMHKIGVEQVT